MTYGAKSLIRIAFLPVALLLVSSSIATAQTAATATAQSTALTSPAFARAIQNKNVVVTKSDGTEFQGIFTVSATGLAGTGKMAGITVPFDQIVAVQKPTYRIRTHSLIGSFVGVGVGYVVSCTNFFRHSCSDGFYLPIGVIAGATGGGIGSIVGSRLNSNHTNDDLVYDARRHATTIAFGPILTATHKGIAFSMTWR